MSLDQTEDPPCFIISPCLQSDTETSWTAQSLLKDIAKQTDPPVHALIDTGALITGMDNREGRISDASFTG